MKVSKHTLISFLLLVLIAALYRAIPGRPWGFAPQFAMAIFGGSVLKDRKMAIALPVLSLLISDLIYQLLFTYGLTDITGFYSGQLENYVLFAALGMIGFMVKQNSIGSIVKGSIASPTAYFFISNFMTWGGNGGFQRPKTFAGLTQCYVDGLPFYTNSILATIFFSAVLFGGNYLIERKTTTVQA